MSPFPRGLRRALHAHPSDPSRAQVVATMVTMSLAGVTAPLVRLGVERHWPTATPIMADVALLPWVLVVVTVMGTVLPWHRHVMGALRDVDRALTQGRATRSERTAYHCRWLLEMGAWALLLTAPPVLLAVLLWSRLSGGPSTPPVISSLVALALALVLCSARTAFVWTHSVNTRAGN